MALKYGFYDSVNGDRQYSGHDFTRIMNNLIMDGVLPQTVGRNQFGARPASSGLGVIIDSGWAWFDSTYTTLTAPQTFPLDAADAVLYRWDAVVIETDPEDRENSIKVIKGTPAAEGAYVKPTLTANQHPLCYIRVTPGLTKLVQSNIENRVGMSDCPFITSIVQTADLTQLFAAWQYDFDEWFENLRVTLSGDVAANLLNRIEGCEGDIEEINTKLDSKLGQSDLTTITAAIGNGENNCRIDYGSYVGNGNAGPNSPNTLTFDSGFQPDFIAIMNPADNYAVVGLAAVRGTTATIASVDARSEYIGMSWGTNSVSWWHRVSFYEADAQLNTNGTTYYYVALGHTPQS